MLHLSTKKARRNVPASRDYLCQRCWLSRFRQVVPPREEAGQQQRQQQHSHHAPITRACLRAKAFTHPEVRRSKLRGTAFITSMVAIGAANVKPKWSSGRRVARTHAYLDEEALFRRRTAISGASLMQVHRIPIDIFSRLQVPRTRFPRSCPRSGNPRSSGLHDDQL